MLGNTREGSVRSDWFRAKKKLAPRMWLSLQYSAMLCAMVDFPVPPRPYSQNMQWSPGSSVVIHLSMAPRRATRVPSRQLEADSRALELNRAACTGLRR